MSAPVADLAGWALAAEVERAALRAWPAAEQEECGGWLLRYSGGYTRRANCANVYGAPQEDARDLILRCEERYRAHKLPPVFRLPGPWAPAEVDRSLEERGYVLSDVTRVLAMDLAAWQSPVPAASVWPASTLDSWMGVFHDVSARGEANRQQHQSIIASTTGTRLLACVGPVAGPTGCGLGIIDGELLGLFDLVVRPDARRKGMATSLIGWMLQQARERGCRWAYLQVTEANNLAASLYARLGFTELYRYWYRQRP